MAGPTVYTDVTDELNFAAGGELFAGKKFWVAQRVPARTRLLDNIKANGGEIELLEKKADYRIADHCRRDCAPGTVSYTFVEQSINDGQLRNPEDHPAGPQQGEAREPGGSTHQPAKSRRTAYTAEEDRILFKWVRDSSAEGGLASGNKIYKQLEAKYPRHTWQSWRDRYLKQLKNRPPSAFNIPDNAPPSPPSDQSNEGLAPGSSASRAEKQPTPQLPQTRAPTEVSGNGKAKTKGDYSVIELEAMFTADDWMELYANVDFIDQNRSDKELYKKGWSDWAEFQGYQTAEQWRQYYERIVRPTWQSDPTWKREQITKKVRRKHDESSSSQAQPNDRQQSPEPDKETETLEGDTEVEDSSAPKGQPAKPLKDNQSVRVPPAYTLFTRERKWDILNAQPGLDYTALHRFLLNEWDSLTEEQRAPYLAMDAAITKETLNEAKELAKLASGIKASSSSTARPESPEYYNSQLQKSMKRMRGDGDVEEQAEEVELPRPVKRLKSASATPTRDFTEPQPKEVGTHDDPLEISSAESSSVTSLSEGAQEPTQDEDEPELVEDLLETIDNDATMVEHDEEQAEEEVQGSIESDEYLDIDELPLPPPGYEAGSDDELPADSPTPRANRQKVSNFDTQAILSSPTQDPSDRILRPQGYVQDKEHHQEQRSSSLAQQFPSDASTTQSLEDFRRSLNEEDLAQLINSQLPPEHNRTSPSPSPTPSSTSSTNSGDPDPPLEADELNEFFDEQLDQGFPNDHIARALTRTRLRPQLAVKVLDAWRLGEPLPSERGVWSVSDDEGVEGGDGVQLAKLERKHTMNGWGGIMERMMFLEANRDR